MPQLEIKNTKEAEAPLSLIDLDKEHFIIGRTENCDLVIEDKGVSRRHVEISLEDGDYFLTDLRSGNGTKLSGRRVRALEKQLLKNGDVIEIEHFRLRFIGDEGSSPSQVEEDTDTDILEIKLIKKMMAALDEDEEPSLEVLSGTAAGLKFSLKNEQESFSMGRSEEADFCIPDNVLSRIHAKLERKWGGVVLVDMNSKNGCFVNGENIREKLLRDGDQVLLGTVRLLYRDPTEVKAQIAHQELSRKKKEAALQEAEALARKQLEEEKKRAEEEAKKQAEAEAEAKALEESLAAEEKAKEEAEAQAQEAANKQDASQKEPQQLPQAGTEAPLEKEKLSATEKVFIVLGILVALLAIGGVAFLLS